MKFRNFQKRIICVILALLMVITLLPVDSLVTMVHAAQMGEQNNSTGGNGAQPYANQDYVSSSRYNVTITVRDENRKAITGAEITVSCGSDTYEVAETGNGQYKFTKKNNNSNTYTIVVSASGYETKTVTMSGRNSSVSITLKKMEDLTSERLETFKVFYISTGKLPNSYAGAGDASDYGPSGNSTPLVLIDVDIHKLRREYSSVAQYNENTTNNHWEFIPKGAAKDMAAVKEFWTAVWECMTDESKAAFEATGLANDFYGYALKQQKGDSTQHCDGVLTKTPPVYVIELYDQGTYFGGSATDSSNPFKKMTDVQEMFETRLGVDIRWTSTAWASEVSGTYYSGGRIYTVKITQTNSGAAQRINGSEIPYESKNSTNTYFLAKFNITVTQGAEGYHTVIYTDGVEAEQVFADQITVLQSGSKAPAFAGTPQRAGYHFLGWMIDDETDLLTDAQIAAMTVRTDMSFHAVWEAIPESFTGTVNVQLNDGNLTDISALINANTALYISKDGVNYTQMVRSAQGVYTAELVNGVWYLYCSSDGVNYVRVDDGALVINNADANRELDFYSVSYDLNGGATASVIPVSYYIKGTQVNVAEVIPTRDGYRFVGWKTGGTIYQPESSLTGSISGAYILVAQWEKKVNITIHVTIDHQDANRIDLEENKDEIHLELVSRADGTAPYLETGKELFLKDAAHVGFAYNPIYGSGANAGVVIKTQYTAEGVTFADMPGGNVEYFVVATKTGYDTTVTATQDADGNWIIHVQAKYDPENFDLHFSVKVDDSIPAPYIPQAVIVKVTYWNGTDWQLITPHTNGEPGVRVNIDPNTRVGIGSYPVLKENANGEPYGYRILVSAFVFPNGTIVPTAEVTANTAWGDKAYHATLNVSGGSEFNGLNGAYFGNSAQEGKLNAIVTMDLHNVTFNPMGGTVNGQTQQIVEDQYKIPTLNDYTPVRAGGYIFEGWYTKDGTNGDWGIRAVEGTDLTEDITLYAKWRAPIKVTGTVYVAGTYELNGRTHVIREFDRTKTVMILLRKQGDSGVCDTAVVTITYGADHVGVGTYTFDGLPDDGTVYYIEERTANYGGLYINEPDSRTVTTDFTVYAASKNTAVLDGDKVAQINAYLPFEPTTFELKYFVDATAIGSPFRPTAVELLVTYDVDHTIVDPAHWPVISQMTFGSDYIGNVITLNAGQGSGSTTVWTSFPNGTILYDYSLRVANVTGAMLGGYTNAPYTVTYQGSAHHVSGGQSKDLIAVLTPNQYTITYELGVDSTVVDGMNAAPLKHTWSFDTDLSGVNPERYGYEFHGWYDNAAFTGAPVTKIDAAVAEDVTLYAKWYQVMDEVDLSVTIIHKIPGGAGEASNYNKELLVQLTHAKEGTTVFEDVVGQSKTYGKEIWHTLGDDSDEETLHVYQIFKGLPYDYAYNVNVFLDEYYVVEKTVTEVVDPLTGATTYQVEITLQYDPDLLHFDFSVEMAPGIDKSLWPVSAEVKVTSWYDHPSTQLGFDWHPITQHETNSITVTLDSTGKGTGYYPVWQWFDKSQGIPYYYRIEISALHLSDGSIVMTSESGDTHDVVYFGGGYSAIIETTNGVAPSGTTLEGAYGQDVSSVHVQVGEIKAVISVDSWKDDPAGDAEIGGDGTADHQQVIVKFQSENENKGILSGALNQVFTLMLQNDGSYSKVITPDVVGITANTAAGYVFSHWTNEAGEEVDPFRPQTMSGGQTYVFIAHWEYNKELSYVVKYLDKNTNEPLCADKLGANITYGTRISAESERIDIPGYAFDNANVDSITVGMEENVLVLYYAADQLDDVNDKATGGDGIPDYRQVLVTFQAAENGTVAGKTTYVITLSEVNGAFIGQFCADEAEVFAKAYEGYKFDRWVLTQELRVRATPVNDADPYAPLEILGGYSYLYTAQFTEDMRQINYPDVDTSEDTTVPVQNAKYIQIKPNGGSWMNLAEDQTIQIAGDYTLADPVREGYLFMGWNRADGAEENVIHVFTAQWEMDTKGKTDSNGEDIADGIPDKYQKKVILKVVNGYWKDGTDADVVLWLLLVDEDGNWDENGSAQLVIPTGMYAQEGYEDGTWDVTPPTKVEGTEIETFTYQFTEIVEDSDNPDTGDEIGDHLWIFVSGLLLSAAALMLLVFIEKRKIR